ncbi:MAG TPA: hypothetical protein VFV47_02720 [Hyphomicrobiaceae bacterium]|nr:hypothetical protein [Hyphomicrobiaceae bacterium]
MDAIEPFIVRNYLLFFLLPIWVVTGALDWWTHRRAGIERFGVREPALHLALLSLAGLPILLGLFLEINAVVVLAMTLCFLVHEAVGYIDIRWASGTRGILPFEQRLHDYLAAIPFAALGLVIVLHWPDVMALATAPIDALREPLELRESPLPIEVIAFILLLVLFGNVLPYLEEFARTLRYQRVHRNQRRDDLVGIEPVLNKGEPDADR